MALDLKKHEVYGTLTFDQVDENWDDIQTLVNQINSRLPQNNWQATTNPTTSNDQTQGFVAGSLWYNKTTGDLFVCTSAATGAAVWVAETTLTFADVTLDAVTTSGNSTTNAVDVGALRSTNWVGTVANGALGHVVERGSNANGEYVKFADGTMITVSSVVSADSNSASGAGFRSGGPVVITNPASFVNTGYSVAGQCDSQIVWCNFFASTTSAAVGRLFSWTSETGIQVQCICVGRWF